MTNNLFIKEIQKTAALDTGCRFLQSAFWASFKGAHGWNPKYFEVCIDDKKFNLTVLVRSFRKACFHFSLAYIPMAPEKGFESNLKDLSEAIKHYLPKDTMCIRYDLPIDFENLEERASYVRGIKDGNVKGLVKADVDIQPPDTVLLNLQKTEEELLANMKNKWRYNIRLAAKKGVEIKAVHAGDADFDAMVDAYYELYMTTASRDGIGAHPKSYYKDLLERGKKGNAESEVTLYIAKHEDDYLAAIITLFCKREAVYLYGCSSNVKRNLMPAYLLQWTAIQDAKKYGCPVYDFYGCPPDDNENHPMHGLFLFKTGFGGTLIHRPGSFDVVLNKSIYNLYSLAERARAFYHKKFLKKIRGR